MTSSNATPPQHAVWFWMLTPDWLQNAIDRAARMWRRIDTDVRIDLGLTIAWACERKRACWCDLFRTEHVGQVHARCRHCTNPAVACGECGAKWLSERDPRTTEWPWFYRGLLEGWRCHRCR